MINFIGREAQTAHVGVDKNITKIQRKTGYEGDNDILRNIYDLEGNNNEWTALAFESSFRVYRGGDNLYAINGEFYPASKKHYSKPDGTNNGYSSTSRITLYI